MKGSCYPTFEASDLRIYSWHALLSEATLGGMGSFKNHGRPDSEPSLFNPSFFTRTLLPVRAKLPRFSLQLVSCPGLRWAVCFCAFQEWIKSHPAWNGPEKVGLSWEGTIPGKRQYLHLNVPYSPTLLGTPFPWGAQEVCCS